ncbi:MAG TPA: c-type cytochrome biogenesis protein CcmI [Thiolapillus brandeum]|uniref:C-type cytochrome biogenesis protein CcmI n=1 Tax=Thiolapillus brandeum TaxID=1076588 RepID=A0A831WGC7_9GAMM|nr:c-type cytochrome biogenesis protein CcmI [Thiolapillus brandeum]
MTFWIIVALMLGLGIAVLAFVLLRKRPDITSNRREQNLLLAKEKLAELDQEKAAGNLDDETYAQAKEELETGLLEDTDVEEAVARVRPASARAAAIAVALLVPLLSVGIYMKLGSPQYVVMSGTPGAQSPHAMNGDGKTPTMAELLTGLEERVKQAPDDPEGWFMLGRVYQSMQRYPDAVKAYEELRKLTDDHPQALIALADSLAMVQGGKLSGRPYELVRQALDKAPDDPTALWLAGQGAMEAGDYQNAIYYWRQAEAGLADKPDYVQELRTLIRQAKEVAAKAGVTIEDPGSSVADSAQPVAAGQGINLSVSLAPALQDKVSPGDRLFIFAKQVQGPPMPVAAVRITAGDLPAKLVLDDSSMLQQGNKLSDYKQLKLAARIAKGSQPMAASGDLQSSEVVVSVGDGKPVELVIDQVVP